MNKEEMVKILNTLASVAMNEAKTSDDVEQAMYWAGIKVGLDTAKYVVVYGKPPETFEDAMIAEAIGSDKSTLH